MGLDFGTLATRSKQPVVPSINTGFVLDELPTEVDGIHGKQHIEIGKVDEDDSKLGLDSFSARHTLKPVSRSSALSNRKSQSVTPIGGNNKQAATGIVDKNNDAVAFALMEAQPAGSPTAINYSKASNSFPTPLICAPSQGRKRTNEDKLVEEIALINIDSLPYRVSFQVHLNRFPKGTQLTSGCIVDAGDCQTPTKMLAAVQQNHQEHLKAHGLTLATVQKIELFLPTTDGASTKTYHTLKKGDDQSGQTRALKAYASSCEVFAKQEAEKVATKHRYQQRLKKLKPLLRDGSVDDELKQRLYREDNGPDKVHVYGKVKLYLK